MREPQAKKIERFRDLIQNRPIEVRSPIRKMRNRVLFGCLECGHEWEATPRDVARAVGSGCGKCARRSLRRPNEVLSSWDNFLRLDISTPKHPKAEMMVNKKRWEILIRGGISRVMLGTKGYPVAEWEGKKQFVHRILMGFPQKPFQVDHKNGVKTDNRLCNLRIVTGEQNQMNRGVRKTNTSGHIGVSPKKNRWEAKLVVGRKAVHRSYHKKLEDAVEARRKAVEDHCGEYAPILI